MKLKREFYERSTLVVARELLGKHLVHVTAEGTVIGKIVEVEAYIGTEDAAAHTYKGLRSNRTEIAFGPGGYAYIYWIALIFLKKILYLRPELILTTPERRKIIPGGISSKKINLFQRKYKKTLTLKII